MNKRFVGLLCLMLSYSSGSYAGCSGHFINPLTDICWQCLFPLSIGSVQVGGRGNDTENPASPIQFCPAPAPLFVRPGLAIGFWEPIGLTDVTRDPYCFVNLGGFQLPIKAGIKGATASPLSETQGAFYQVHWYQYPLIAWLKIITSLACLQGGNFDISYVTELDPAWNNDELSMVINPEAALFANLIAQLACAADAVKTITGTPINALFWCMGAQGSSYPLTGHVSHEYSVLQNATLLSERMIYKLHRELLMTDSSGKDNAVCIEHLRPIIPKNRYRYELMNPRTDKVSSHPFGHTVTSWQMGKITPNDNGNYGFLIWRKRNCVFL